MSDFQTIHRLNSVNVDSLGYVSLGFDVIFVVKIKLECECESENTSASLSAAAA